MSRSRVVPESDLLKKIGREPDLPLVLDALFGKDEVVRELGVAMFVRIGLLVGVEARVVELTNADVVQVHWVFLLVVRMMHECVLNGIVVHVGRSVARKTRKGVGFDVLGTGDVLEGWRASGGLEVC